MAQPGDLITTDPDGKQRLHITINAGPDYTAAPGATGGMGGPDEDGIDDLFMQRADDREFARAQADMERMGIAQPKPDPLTEWERTRKPEVLAAMGLGQPAMQGPDLPAPPGQGASGAQERPGTEEMDPLAMPEEPSDDGKPGFFSRAVEVYRSQGASFMSGAWKSIGGVVEAMDDMADLAHKLVETRLRDAGYTDADLERMGVSKVKLFENWLAWTDHYAKHFDKKVTVKDFWSTLYSALGQAPVGMLEFAYGGGWYPMRELIKSTHQQQFGTRPGETPTIGNQVTANPVGAAAVDAAAGSFKWATNRIINVGTDVFNMLGRVASQAGWGAVDAALDPAKINQGQFGTMEEVMVSAATQGLFGAFGGGKPEGWLDVRRLTASEAAPFSENVAAAYEALRAGQMDQASYNLVKTLAARMPELDAQTQFKVSDELLLASAQISEAAGLKVGEVGQIVGKATTSFEEGVFKAVVDLYSGHDAGTVIHEFGHRMLDQIGKAERGEITVNVGGQDVTADFVKAGQELRQAFEQITGRRPGQQNYDRAFREFVVEAYTAWFVENKAWEDPTPKDGVTPVFAKVKEVLSAVFKRAGEIEGSKLPDSIETAFRRTAGLEGGVEMAGNGEGMASAMVKELYNDDRTLKVTIYKNEAESNSGLLKDRAALKEFLSGIKPEEVTALKLKSPEEYYSTLQSIVEKFFPEGAGIKFRSEKGGEDPIKHLLKERDRREYIHTLPRTLKDADIKVEFRKDSAEKALLLKKFFNAETQKDLWDVIVVWDRELQTKWQAIKRPDSRAARTILAAGEEASPRDLLSGSKEIAPSPSSTAENIATQENEGKIESNSIRPLVLRPWEFGGAPDQLVEVRERVDAVQETMIRGTLPTEFRKYAVNINLEKVESLGDVQGVIQATADALKPQMEAARRGIVGDAAVREGALDLLGATTRDVAGDLGLTEETLLQRRQGEAFNAEYALASRIILYNSAQNLADMARSVRAGRNSDSELLDFRRRLELHIGLQAQVSGIAAEAGRALRSFRQMAGTVELAPGVYMNPNRVRDPATATPDFRMPGEAPSAPEVVTPGQTSLDAFRHLIDSAGGRKAVQEMANAIADMADQGADLTQLNVAARQATKRTWKDWVLGWRYHSMLSGVPTHIRNTVGNTLTAAMAVPETAVASLIGVANKALGSRASEHVELGEARELLFGYLGALGDSFRLAGMALKTGESKFGVNKTEGRPEVTIGDGSEMGLVGKAAGIVWDFINIPGRVLGAEDEFFKNETFRAELRRLAYRQASMEGKDGRDLGARAQELLNDPPDYIAARALDAAKARTFNKELEGAIGSLSHSINQSFMGKIFIPFIRTPWNIFQYTMVRTPLAPAFKGFRDDIRAGGARAELALAQVAVGSALMAWATSLVDQGVITGGDPTDPGERAVWLLTNQPYSVKIGDNWYSWGGVGEPVTTFFALAADFHQAYNTWNLEPESSPSELASALTVAFSKNITSKTFLKGVSDLTNVLSDPDRYAETFIGGLGGSFVPAYLGNWAMAQDPEIRLVGGVLDAALNRVPGARGTLPVRRNLWGEPVLSTQFGPEVAWWSPVKLKKDNGTPIDREMLELGMGVRMPKETIDTRGGEVELTKSEYSRYMELVGEVTMSWKGTPMTIKDWLNEYIASPGYQRLKDRDAQSAAASILDVIHAFQEMARDRLYEENPRIADMVDMRNAEKRAGR
ncbi:MAG: hypothetical protein ACOZEN_13070 [Thermodesulfobacteriota bacterium]